VAAVGTAGQPKASLARPEDGGGKDDQADREREQRQRGTDAGESVNLGRWRTGTGRGSGSANVVDGASTSQE